MTRRSDLCARIAPALACSLLLAVGCGYRPYEAGDLPPAIQRLHVAPLANGTFKPGLQGLVGAAILRHLRQDSRVRLVPPDAADAILAGRLTAYQNLPLAFDQNDIGRRFRVRLTLAFTVTERGGEKVFLKGEIAGEAFYSTGNDVVATRSAEEEAAQRAAQDLASLIVARLMEGL